MSNNNPDLADKMSSKYYIDFCNVLEKNKDIIDLDDETKIHKL